MPISVALALVLAEKIVRFANPQVTYMQAQQVSLKAYQKSDYLPFVLKPNNSTVHYGNTHEFAYSIKTNSSGYRMEEFSAAKPKDEYRILMLGDSLIFGFGVEVEDNIPSKLKNKLNKYLGENGILDKKIQIINAGFVDGKSPDTYYLYLKKEGLKLSPDLVIVNYFINNDIVDLDDNIWEKVDSSGLPEVISSRTAYIDGVYYRLKSKYQNWKYAIPILRDSHLWILFATAMETKSPDTVAKIRALLKNEDLPLIATSENDDCLYENKCSAKMNELFERFFKLARGTAEVARRNNIPIIVSLLSANPQVETQVKRSSVDSMDLQKATIGILRDTYKGIEPQKKIEDFLDSEKIAYIDPFPYVADPNWNIYFYQRDGHPKPAGNERFALAFFDFLTGNFNILEKVRNL